MTKVACVSILFKKTIVGGYEQKLRSRFVDYEDNDDEFTLKAKAERYFRSESPEAKVLNDFHILMYNVGTCNVE